MAYKLDPEIKRTLLEDGMVKVPGLLDSDQLAHARKCFEWSLENPSPRAVRGDEPDGTIYRIDNDHPDALSVYADLARALPFADLLKQAWDSEHIWFLAEETFWKKGNAGRTVWHQDTSYSHWAGEHIVNCWMSFDSVPKSHSLEVIRSSHHGTLYDGSAFDPEDPTAPLWGDQLDPPLPRLPDIERERAADPNSWDVVSYDVEPGDVILVHPSSLHGGAPVDESFGERRTLVLRYFGDDAVWSHHLPQPVEELDALMDGLTDDQMKATSGKETRGKAGDPYRPGRHLQII